MDQDETWNISEGPWYALTQKLGEIAPGVPLKCAKMYFVLFSDTNAKWTFSHLSCTNFDHF